MNLSKIYPFSLYKCTFFYKLFYNVEIFLPCVSCVFFFYRLPILVSNHSISLFIFYTLLLYSLMAQKLLFQHSIDLSILDLHFYVMLFDPYTSIYIFCRLSLSKPILKYVFDLSYITLLQYHCV